MAMQHCGKEEMGLKQLQFMGSDNTSKQNVSTGNGPSENRPSSKPVIARLSMDFGLHHIMR
jgi:hypothetical protein